MQAQAPLHPDHPVSHQEGANAPYLQLFLDEHSSSSALKITETAIHGQNPFFYTSFSFSY